MKKKKRIYIETTVVSLLTARPAKDTVLRADQIMTKEFWRYVLPQCDAFISSMVWKEAMQGDPAASKARTLSLRGLSLLHDLHLAESMATVYVREKVVPEKAMADATHMAMASLHRMDYLLTWNCRHLANQQVRSKLDKLNFRMGMQTPYLCTPREFMEIYRNEESNS